MPVFAKGIPRLAVTSCVVLAFCLVPPELLDRGPDLCLWRHLFHLTACPSCGSTRALAAFFHGEMRQALAYNRNVLITGPVFLAMLAKDVSSLARIVLHGIFPRLLLTGNPLEYRPS
jgi:hypothetical protein